MATCRDVKKGEPAPVPSARLPRRFPLLGAPATSAARRAQCPTRRAPGFPRRLWPAGPGRLPFDGPQAGQHQQ
jgi:hypothetical protein